MMKDYVVYRKGWNKANQSSLEGCPEVMAVARVQANSAEEAVGLARNRVTCYNNQFLFAEEEEDNEENDRVTLL